MASVKTADVLVIGAGIIGAACAFRLAERGFRVRVLERARTLGEGSTGRSGAGVRVQFSEAVNVRLSWESLQEYRTFGERYGAPSGYVPNGYLFLVPEQAWEAHLKGVTVQRRVGAPVEVLNPHEAQALVPFVPDGVAGCTYGPADGYIDPVAVLRVYLEQAERRGAQLHLGAAAGQIECASGGWRVGTAEGTFEAPNLVNAAGAWAGAVARLAGLAVPVVPLKRSVYRTLGGNGGRGGAPSYPLTVDVASNFWLRGHNETLIFTISNPHQAPGFHEGMDWDWLESVRQVGETRFPWLKALKVDPQGSFWGFYEMTPDGSPILGEMPDAPGWFNACGFSGHGVQQAAAVGRVVAAEVAGEAPPIPVEDLRLERFSRPATFLERHIV